MTTVAELQAQLSPYCCRDCGARLTYRRVFEISREWRAHGKRATRADMACDEMSCFIAPELRLRHLRIGLVDVAQ